MSEEKDEKPDPSKKIIIEGITKSGETFRPGDWAERISGQLSSFAKHRIAYSPLLKPITKEGYKCVLLDPELKKSNPELYASIIDFADKNNLRICKDDES